MGYKSITSKPTVNAESVKMYYYPKIRNIFKKGEFRVILVG